MSEVKEIWKPVPGYEGIYEASNLGRVKRVSPARGTTVGYIFDPPPDFKGYLLTRLTDANGKGRTWKMHRIIAVTWIPNPENHPQVNHKDTIKTNNRVDNLEWCTNLHNKKHAMDNGIIPRGWLGKFGKDHNKSIPIRCVNIDTGEERVIIGINQVARELKTSSPAIWRVLVGEYRHTKRWTFSRI